MARIRSVKPSLRTSEVVRQWPFEVRYFWVLLWGYLDDEGRGLDIPRLIAADCYPRDDEITPLKVDRWLTLMARTRRDPGRDPPVCRYTVSNVKYIHAVHWKDDSNQRPNRPTPSRLPQCPIHESLTERRRESLTESPLSPHVLEGEGEGELGGGGAFSEPLTPPPAPKRPAGPANEPVKRTRPGPSSSANALPSPLRAPTTEASSPRHAGCAGRSG